MPGTTISSAAVNSDFSDIAAALTDSLAADGQTIMTGPIKAEPGTAGAPAYTSTTDLTTGFYFPTAGQMDWTYSGTTGAVFNFDSAGGVQFNGAITVAGNATVSGAMTVTGALTANSIAFTGTGAIQIPEGTTAQRPAVPAGGDIRYSSTNGNFEGYDGTEWQVMSGNTAPFTLTASVGSNLLTVSLLNTKTGAAPTAADPVAITFRDVTSANGDPVSVLVTSALSISTNATGASLGTQSSNVPFRLWILAFNNAGTVELALWHSGAGAAAPAINPLNEALLESTTGIGSGATSAGVFYTPNGVSLTSCAFRIIGYLDYASGLTTAGTYASAPTKLQLFGPGIAKPGQIVNSAYATANTETAINSTTSNTATNLAGTIVVSSSPNPVRINANACMTLNQDAVNTGGQYTLTQLYRGGSSGTAVGGAQTNRMTAAVITSTGISLSALDSPGAGSSTYTVCVKNSTNNAWNNIFLDTTVQTPVGTMTLDEIQA